MIGTQCPYGMLSDPIPTRPELTGCPMDVRSLKIIGASPLYFMGDCTEKTIAVRTADNLLDTLWQVYPDDRFRVSPGPFWIRLEIPEVGQCWTPATLRLEGSLSCSDQDRMRLEFTRLDADLVSEGVPPQPGITRCPLPPGCRLRSRASLSQCTP